MLMQCKGNLENQLELKRILQEADIFLWSLWLRPTCVQKTQAYPCYRHSYVTGLPMSHAYPCSRRPYVPEQRMLLAIYPCARPTHVPGLPISQTFTRLPHLLGLPCHKPFHDVTYCTHVPGLPIYQANPCSKPTHIMGLPMSWALLNPGLSMTQAYPCTSPTHDSRPTHTLGLHMFQAYLYIRRTHASGLPIF